jgi:hypothetical protein
MDYASCPHGWGDQWLDFQPCGHLFNIAGVINLSLRLGTLVFIQ